MTPAQAAALADDCARVATARIMPGIHDRKTGAEVHGIVLDAVNAAIDRALSSVRPPYVSRVESAEREVVRTAMEWWEDQRKDLPAVYVPSTAAREACERLRDLRASIGEPECGSTNETVVEEDGNTVGPPSRSVDVRCDQPHGHDGDHEGPLPRWRWPNRGEG